MAVQAVLEKLDIAYVHIELGKVKLAGAADVATLGKLNGCLKKYELELMDDKRKILVEQVKTLIIKLLQSTESDEELKFSEHVSRSLHYDYTYLANIFSEMEGSTIEKFYITQRIERVKELMVYENLSVSEISHHLNFSSVSHLCLQFKKVTGQTPSAFKKLCATEDFVWRKCE
jgi:AraC-like DNA-binding protein